MGLMKYYLDACIIIYLIERVSGFQDKLFKKLPAKANIVTSDLTRLECRVKPLQISNDQLIKEYNYFFSNSIEIQKVSPEVIDKATEIRSNYSIKTPDSIHLASAIVSNSTYFLTNDKRLSSFKEIEIITL